MGTARSVDESPAGRRPIADIPEAIAQVVFSASIMRKSLLYIRRDPSKFPWSLERIIHFARSPLGFLLEPSGSDGRIRSSGSRPLASRPHPGDAGLRVHTQTGTLGKSSLPKAVHPHWCVKDSCRTAKTPRRRAPHDEAACKHRTRNTSSPQLAGGVETYSSEAAFLDGGYSACRLVVPTGPRGARVSTMTPPTFLLCPILSPFDWRAFQFICVGNGSNSIGT